MTSRAPAAARANGPVVHDHRERKHGLARPAGERVEGDGQFGREAARARAEAAAPRSTARCPNSENQMRVKTRAAPMPPRASQNRRAAASCGARSKPGEPKRGVRLDRRVQIGLAVRSRSTRARPAAAGPAARAMTRGVVSSSRMPMNSRKKRCCAVIVTFDSSSPTHQPPGSCSSSSRVDAAFDSSIEPACDGLRSTTARSRATRSDASCASQTTRRATHARISAIR